MGEEAFQDRLMPGERIVWSGGPGTGFLLTARDFFLVPFSLIWTGMVIFIFAAGSQTNAPFPYQFVPVLFGLFGFYAVIGRFFVDIWLRGHTSYAVTSQRVLIFRSAPAAKFTALALDRLPELSLQEKRDGSGTIRFGQSASLFYGRGFSSWTPALDPVPQFLAIPDARNVFGQIQRLSAAKA